MSHQKGRLRSSKVICGQLRSFLVRKVSSCQNFGKFERGRAAFKFWSCSLARQKSSNSQLTRSRSLATFFGEVQLAARSLV